MNFKYGRKTRYDLVPTDEEHISIKSTQPPSGRSSSIDWCCQLVILSLSVIFFVCGYRQRDVPKQICEESVYSPAADVIEHKVEIFSQSWLNNSVFRGTPRPELDEAWDAISKGDIFPGPTLSISEQELELMGRGSFRDVTVRLPENYGGGYLASMEVFHNLHCLNMLRMVIHKDYYKEMAEPWLQNHIDHCIGMIRQRLMCTADVGIITGVWVNHFGAPYPDFRTQHQCRNFEKIQQWAKDHEVKVSMEEVKAARGPHNLTAPPIQDIS